MENESYDTLCTFGSIPHTPAWYYNRYPGFFNVECYKILSSWEHGVPDDPAIEPHDIDIVFMESTEDKNKKRKYRCENIQV